MKRASFGIAMSLALAAPATAELAWVRTDWAATIQQNGLASGGTPAPRLVVFTNVEQIEIQETQTDSGKATNPLYKDKGIKGDNPLYNGSRGSEPGSELEVGDFASVLFTLSTPSLGLARDGIIHRDLAARNILLRTAQGDYSGGFGPASLGFSSDGPLDFRATAGDPPIPIRWTPTETIRLFLGGDANSGMYIDLTLGTELRTFVVPAPGSAWVGLVTLAALRRRR